MGKRSGVLFLIKNYNYFELNWSGFTGLRKEILRNELVGVILRNSQEKESYGRVVQA